MAKRNESVDTDELDKQTSVHRLVLPEELSIDNVASLFEGVKKMIKMPSPPSIEIDFSNVKKMDSSAIAFFNYLKRKTKAVSFKNISPEFTNMLSMFPLTAMETKKKRPAGRTRYAGHVEGFGNAVFSSLMKLYNFLVLLVDEIYYTIQFAFRRRGVYPGEISNQLFFMAYKSSMIVSVISFLVGLTISVTSIKQLRRFGADLYLADLVGYGMIRELVPMMTGIILAGKIGASITAEVASMKVMEETDALKTMGIIPERFLMVPRLIAITLATPLLVALADFIGIFAGIMVARIFSDIPADMFFKEMLTAVDLSDFLVGLLKTMFFGWVIVLCSGYKGFSVKQGATGVGIATTESVVLSISLIIIFDCLFAFVLY